MKKIAVIGGGAFGILTSLKLSKQKDAQITLFEQSGRLGGLSVSEKYKGQYMDYSTKFITCNQFGKPGIPSSLETLLTEKNVLLDDIGDYHFLKDKKEVPLPPVFKNVSKVRILKEAVKILKYFPQADRYSNMVDMEQIDGFVRSKTMQELAGSLGFQVFAEMIEYFSMIFGNSTRGAEALSVLTSRNSYTTYNYLKKVFTKSKGLEFIGSSIDKTDLLNKHDAVPYKFLMLTKGYDVFLQSILEDIENVDVQLHQTIVDIDRDPKAISGNGYVVINKKKEVFSGFDEIVFAIPMVHLKKFKYSYIQDLVSPIGAEKHNYVLTSFCKLEESSLRYMRKGIYLDYENPHGIGTSNAKKDGSLYGFFKQFNAETMFQSLTMVNDIDHEKIDEGFIHQKWCQATQEFKFNISPQQVKPYGWKVLKWNTPFAQVGDFAHFEKIHLEQGKQGIWFGGEIMCGPGIPVILKYIEDLFGPL